MKRICEAAILFIGTFGWWGFVYPELCLTEETYEQEYEGQEYEQQGEDKTETGKTGETELKMADTAVKSTDIAVKKTERPEKAEKSKEISGTIRIKSRLVEYLYDGG